MCVLQGPLTGHGLIVHMSFEKLTQSVFLLQVWLFKDDCGQGGDSVKDHASHYCMLVIEALIKGPVFDLTAKL